MPVTRPALEPEMMDLLRTVSFPSRDSRPVELEGRFHTVEGQGRWPAAILCHPHPLGGGTMYNKVVSAINRALVSRGVLALRFNFRGAGRSGGSYDQGRGEQADVAGALDWLLDQPQVDPWRVSLVGYSFGAWVGLAHAQTEPRIAAVAAVGLPAWTYDAGFSRRNPPPRLGEGELWQYDPQFMHPFARPKLFVTGEADQIAPPAALQKLVDKLPEPKTLEIVTGVDHLWRGHERELGRRVARFVSSL